MDYEVLTDTGWKNYRQISPTDKIATLKNDKLEYDKIIASNYWPKFSEKMVHIQTRQIELNVSANKKIYVSCESNGEWSPYGLIQASNIIGKKIKFKKTAHWTTQEYQFMLPPIKDSISREIPSRLSQEWPTIVNMNAWIKFFGIWIVDGWLTHSVDDPHKISIRVSKKNTQTIIETIIEALCFNYDITEMKSSVIPENKIRIMNRQLYEYLMTIGLNAIDKHLPDWVWQLSSKQARMLLDTMITDDNGYKTLFYTSSKQLADDMMRLCLHAGISGNIMSSIGFGIINNIYNVKINLDTYSLNSEEPCERKLIEETTVPCEPLFNIQLPSEIFYVRYNGKGMWI